MSASKPKLKLTAFISSTSKDLKLHRERVRDAVWRFGLFPEAMERDETALDTEAIDYSLNGVDQAHVYIGIFAHRYGYIPDDPRNPHGISITEMEYRQAVENGIPRLVFLVSDAHSYTVADMKNPVIFEQDEAKQAALKRLKDELGATRFAGFYDSADDLGHKVFEALYKLREEGKIAAPEPERSTTALPAPPEPYIPHAYVLTRKFFGREDELKLLDTWGASSTDTTMIVEAIGGVGKSALTWEWFNRHHADYEASFWWSFYESDSAVTNFLRHALAYLEGKAPDDYDARKFEDNERRLLHLLTHRRCLLVLDGIERILVAYHRLNAAQMTDEAAETEPVRAHGGAPGSPETTDRTADDTRRRACTDPRHGALLQKLATCAPTKVLISTRLIPADLQDKSNRLIDRVRHHHLNGMLPDDALAYIRHLGVTGDPARLKAFMEQFGRHSLLIGIIAGRINDYFPAPGDFDTWYADEGATLKLHDLDLQQRRTHILAYALQDLKPELKQFLGQIAAFSFPLDYPTLAAFNPYAPPRPVEPRKPYLSSFASEQRRTEQEKAYRESPAYNAYQLAVDEYEANLKNVWRPQFHAALHELEDRGLLQWDRTASSGGRYDLHPVVRGYAFSDLPDSDRRTAYDRIRSHFEQQPEEDPDTVQDLSGLRRSLEIYRALVGEGLLDRAADFYRSRLSKFLYFQLNAYHAILELLGPLFPAGPAALPTLSDPAVQSAVVNDLASALGNIGQSEQARQLLGLKFKINLGQRNAGSLGVGLGNYGISLHDRVPAAAHHVYILALDLAAAADRADNLATAHLRLLSLYKDIGDWTAAEAAYQAFAAAPPQQVRTLRQAEAERHRAYTLFYRGDDPAAITAQIETAWSLAKRARNLTTQRELLTLRGELALRLDQPEEAAGHFAEALRLARQAGVTVSERVGGLARSYAMQGQHADARSMLPEADEISRAEVYLLFGETDAAREAALKAYQLAWADGPPYSFWYELERTKKVLDALNVPYPDLPPFDPSKVEPIPYEDEIRAFIAELQAKKAKRRR